MVRFIHHNLWEREQNLTGDFWGRRFIPIFIREGKQIELPVFQEVFPAASAEGLPDQQ
jgi:hypothetical protein